MTAGSHEVTGDARTTAAHNNPPRQRDLRYRVGTHSTFLRRMLSRLSTEAIPDGRQEGARPLVALTTRERSDAAIAFLDAVACVGDVLTFYQERIANEGYLHTAEEHRSLLELARAVGYERRPGVAASAWLAFTVDDPPEVVTVPAGTQVMSIPGQGERPQTFETSEGLVARAAWNELRPAKPHLRPQTVAAGSELVLEGTGTDLQPGDGLLLVRAEWDAETRSDAWNWLTVRSVDEDRAEGRTRVVFDGELADAAENPVVFAFRQRAALFGHDAPDWRSLPDWGDYTVEGVKVNLPVSKERFLAEAGIDVLKPPASFVFPDTWPSFRLDETAEYLAEYLPLDAVYPKILTGSWVVLADQGSGEAAIHATIVDGATIVQRSGFTLQGKVTQLELSKGVDPEAFSLRGTLVYAQSERLELARVHDTVSLEGVGIELERVEPEPEPGQALIFEGTEGGASAARGPGEVAFVKRVEPVAEDADRMSVILRGKLSRRYDPHAVVIHGNAISASHGETVREVLGSGDGRLRNQRFELRVPPLTHVSAPPEGGVESTLELRVNDVRWREVASLEEIDERAQAYTLRRDEDDRTTVVFGDGVHGARLPSGSENVTATYRSGLGVEGNVNAETLALLQTRPPGIRTVTNPLPASGGASPDGPDDMRTGATRNVLTMGRIVSLSDFESYARGFGGIGKAGATLLPGEGRPIVHLTVAGTEGKPVPPESDLYVGLSRAVTAADPTRSARIDSYTRRTFGLAATLGIDPRHRASTVLRDVRDELLDAYSFEARAFGQPVYASEVIAVIQAVTGVLSVDLDKLGEVEDASDVPTTLHAVIEARNAHRDAEGIRPAELWLLALGDHLTVREVAR